MVSRDMCGHEGASMEAIVEGVLLKVCEKCSKHGNVVAVKKVFKRDRDIDVPIKKEEPEEELILVNDFADRIRKAREEKGLKQIELAAHINEKESVFKSIESGHIEPSIVLAKKLERFLGIQLVETKKLEKSKKIDFRSSELTIGDLLSIGKKNE